MRVSTLNGVKIYDLSTGKSLPEYMEEAKKRNVKLNTLDEYRNRIDLIQDLEFKVASQRIVVSNDQNYIVASGVYPPRVKIFETGELGLKVEPALRRRSRVPDATVGDAALKRLWLGVSRGLQPSSKGQVSRNHPTTQAGPIPPPASHR